MLKCCGHPTEGHPGTYFDPPEAPQCCNDPEPGLEWIIVGGESTQGKGKARPFDLAWARSTVAQCKAAGVPVFMKQLGSAPVQTYDGHHTDYGARYGEHKLDRAGADPAEWPSDLRLREFPE
jgi:hypothetical protein